MNCAYYKLNFQFRSCFKTLFICTLNASKVIFVTFNLNWGLHNFCRKTVCTDVKFLDGSESVLIFYIWIQTEFRFSAHPAHHYWLGANMVHRYQTTFILSYYELQYRYSSILSLRNMTAECKQKISQSFIYNRCLALPLVAVLWLVISRPKLCAM